MLKTGDGLKVDGAMLIYLSYLKAPELKVHLHYGGGPRNVVASILKLFGFSLSANALTYSSPGEQIIILK
jgi:hypothetical protein